MNSTHLCRINCLARGPVARGFWLLLMLLGHNTGSRAQTLNELAGPQPFHRTEQREPCSAYTALRRPLFGDLHVHTSYSHDAYVSMQRNDPWDAYRYAKGEALSQPDAAGD